MKASAPTNCARSDSKHLKQIVGKILDEAWENVEFTYW